MTDENGIETLRERIRGLAADMASTRKAQDDMQIKQQKILEEMSKLTLQAAVLAERLGPIIKVWWIVVTGVVMALVGAIMALILVRGGK